MTSSRSAPVVSAEKVSFLHENINTWFGAHARDLPWRADNRTGWSVMVSEFMLQQTPVKRVLPIWEIWMERWPTPADLAAVDSAEAVRAWGRLGYPRRALRLHAAAQAIVNQHSGVVPETYDELLALPGVGTYTAAAITVFAFGNRATVVDTNIRRVFGRAVLGKALPGKSLTAAEMRLAESLMPDNLRESVVWNAATMELGALVCTAKSPKCEVCPVQEQCAWVAAGKPEADYVPRGQAWAGTDRQLRGAMMAVLRDAIGPIDSQILLSAGQADLIYPQELLPAVNKLRKLAPGQEQINRCYSGLLTDGLAKQDAAGMVSL